MKNVVEDLRYALRHPWVRAGTWAAAGALLLVFGIAALGRPARSEHQALERSIAEKRREIASNDRAGEITSAYERAREKLPRMEQRLHESVGQARLVAEISALARRNGVRIVGQSFEEQKADGGLQSLAAELSAQGRYGALRDFVQSLYGLPLWVEVHELRIAAERSAQGEVSAQIRLLAYRAAKRPS